MRRPSATVAQTIDGHRSYGSDGFTFISVDLLDLRYLRLWAREDFTLRAGFARAGALRVTR